MIYDVLDLGKYFKSLFEPLNIQIFDFFEFKYNYDDIGGLIQDEITDIGIISLQTEKAGEILKNEGYEYKIERFDENENQRILEGLIPLIVNHLLYSTIKPDFVDFLSNIILKEGNQLSTNLKIDILDLLGDSLKASSIKRNSLSFRKEAFNLAIELENVDLITKLGLKLINEYLRDNDNNLAINIINQLEEILKDKEKEEYINDRLIVSHSLINIKSERLHQRFSTIVELEKIVENEMIDIYSYIPAALTYCELLLSEYKSLKSVKIKTNLMELFDHLRRQKYNFSGYWTVFFELLSTKLMCIDNEFQGAYDQLEQMKKEIEDERLLKIINDERERIDQVLSDFQEIKNKNPKLISDFEFKAMENYIMKVNNLWNHVD